MSSGDLGELRLERGDRLVRLEELGFPPLDEAQALLGAIAANERREVYRDRLAAKTARLAEAAQADRRGAKLRLQRALQAELYVRHPLLSASLSSRS